MKCEGFEAEIYDVFPLGTPDPPERTEIQSHLDQGCETCLAALRNSLQFWYAYSVMAAEPLRDPPAALRDRLLRAATQAAGHEVVTMRPATGRFVRIWKP